MNIRITVFFITHLLLNLPQITWSLTCDSGGALCVAKPSGCTSDCDLILRYAAASDLTTEVELSGKLTSNSLSSTDTSLWLAFALTDNGRMSGNMVIYSCQLVSNSYSAKKLPATGYGVDTSQSVVIDKGDVTGSLVDGTMSCSFTMDNTNLPSVNKIVVLGMGRMGGVNDLRRHSRTPTNTGSSLTLIQQFGQAGCSKPSVPNSSIAPTSALIDHGSSYTVTCSTGFTISGSDTITCTDGTLSTTPICNPDPCSKPADIPNGSITPDSDSIPSGYSYTVTCDGNSVISGGDGTVTCTNGALPALPTCTTNDVTSCAKPDIADGTVLPDPGPIGTGESYTVTCDTGYKLSDTSTSPDILCTDGVLGSPLPTCTRDGDVCVKPSVSHGTVLPSQGVVSVGEDYTVVCDDGHSGGGTLTCLSGGTLPDITPCTPDASDDDTSTCTVEGKCYSCPRNCSLPECSFRMTWTNSTVTDKIDVEISGILTEFRLEEDENVWLAFGFSQYGTMTNSDIYLCLKTGSTYTTKKVKGYSHGLETDSETVIDAGVVGTYTDGRVTCSYSIRNSDLTDTIQPMFYGAGLLDDEGNVLVHTKVPSQTREKFSFLSNEVQGGTPISARVSDVLLILCMLTAVAVLL